MKIKMPSNDLDGGSWFSEIMAGIQKAAMKEGIDEGDIVESKNIAAVLIREGFENDIISELTELGVAKINSLR